MDLITWTAYAICIPILFLLAVIATILNLAVFSSRFFVKSRSSSLELTYSLAISDTWTSFNVALSLFWNSYKPVILDWRHDDFCFPLSLEAFRTGGMLTGVIHLAALACVHYLQIVRPFDHTRILTLRQTHFLIVLIWIVPPISLFVYFASWPDDGFRIPLCSRPDGGYYFNNIYFRTQISLIIIVLMVATCFIYWRLLRVVNKVRLKTVSLPHNNKHVHTIKNGTNNSNNNNGPGSSRGRRTVVTATLIFGTFICGWILASTLFILTAEGMPLKGRSGSWITVLFFCSILCIMLKSFANPIIYATRIPEIRSFVRNRILGRLYGGRLSQEMDEMSTTRRRSEFTNLRHSTLVPNQDCTSVAEKASLVINT